jgi:putative transposase
MWAKKGKQPVIPMKFSGRPERRTLFGAVNLKTGKLLGQIAERGNTETFRAFLKIILRRNPRGPIILILDNIRFHHAKALRAWRQSRPRLRFLFLPPYQPKLNPQEMVWQIMRRNVTHNRYYRTFAAEQRAAQKFFKEQTIKFLRTPASLIIRK